MEKNHLASIFVIIGLFANGFFVSDAFAYIDPGTGSLIIQIIIGALAGIGITLKIYWYKIKQKFKRKEIKNED